MRITLKLSILAFVFCNIVTADQNTGPALSLKVHATPEENSAIVTNIDPSKGITVLPNNWVKVLDNSTNKIGWVTQDELSQALKQDNIWIKKISESPNGNFKEVSEIKTGKSAEQEYKQVITSVSKQHKIMNDNFNKAMQQIKKLEESLFDNFSTNSHSDNKN